MRQSSGSFKNTEHHFRFFVYFIIAVTALVFSTESAWAHKVTIFAWVEGDTVYTQSKFSGGRKAQNSTVVVYDKEGKQLLEGRTDQNGEFAFKIPKITELKVALKASMGHLAEWTIPVEELTGAEASNDPPAKIKSTTANLPPESAPLQVQTANAESTTVGLTEKEVRKIVDASLDQKLQPIKHMLVDSIDCGPGLTEIIGGIGYIFGLVGVALSFTNRRKNIS
jgi:nickel transport protein